MAACGGADGGAQCCRKTEPAARGQPEKLAGKTFVVQGHDTGGQAAFTYRGGFFRPLFAIPETPDLAFRANLSAFLQVASRQEDPDTLFFNPELSIEGDTELGLVVKNMLDAVDVTQLRSQLRFPSFPVCPAVAFRHRR